MVFNKKYKYERPKRYSYFSDGNSFDFNPDKTVNFNGEFITMLELHKRQVLLRRKKSVFILDETGKVLPVS